MKNIFKFWNTKNILSNIKACVPIMPIAAVGILILILSGCGNKARPDINIEAIPSPSGWTNDKVDVTFKRFLTDAQCETELNKYYTKIDIGNDSLNSTSYQYTCKGKSCTEKEYNKQRKKAKDEFCPRAGRYVNTVYGITSNGKRTKKGTFNGYKYKLPYVVGNIDTIKPTLSVTNSSSSWKKYKINIKIESKDARGNGYRDLKNNYNKVASGLKYVKYSWDNESRYSTSLYSYKADIISFKNCAFDFGLGDDGGDNDNECPKIIKGNYTENFSDTIKLDKEGVHTLYVKVMDNATDGDGIGNINTASRTYKLDKTDPEVWADETNTNKWLSGSIDISVSKSDPKNKSNNTNGSGLEYAKYKWDANTCASNGSDFLNKNKIPFNQEGQHTLYLCAKDNAGNPVLKSFGTYKLDTTKPDISVTNKVEGNNYIYDDWSRKDIHITLSATDPNGTNGSLIKYKKYIWSYESGNCKDNGHSFPADNKITLSKEGEHKLYVCAEDNAGNFKQEEFGTYKLDKTDPSIKILETIKNHKAGNNNFKVKFKLFDNLNGGNNQASYNNYDVKYKYTITADSKTTSTGYLNKKPNITIDNTYSLTDASDKVSGIVENFNIKIEFEDKAGNTGSLSKDFHIYPADLNEDHSSITLNTPANTKYANVSAIDKYNYTITLKDEFDNEIYDKKITNLLHIGDTIYLDEVNKSGGSALIYPTSDIGPSDADGKISFDLKSYTPGDFDQKFKITIQKWNDNYDNISSNQSIEKWENNTVNNTNSFKTPISGKIDTATSPLTGTDVGEPQIGKNITYNFVLTNFGNVLFTNGKVDLGTDGDYIKLKENGHYWQDFKNKTNDGHYYYNDNIDNSLVQRFSGLIDARSDFLTAPELTTSGAIISYKLPTNIPGIKKTSRYYLDDMGSSYGSSCSPTTLGVKIVGNIQGDGKLATIRGGNGQNISDLSKASLRGKIRANAYKAIRNRENTKLETVNGIYYNTGNIKYGDIKGLLNKNDTVIIENGNFIINEDIPSDKMIGIIVLKDRYKITDDFNNKGNVYVTSNVEKINAVIYADGAFRSAYLDTTNGIIKEYTSDYDLKDKLTLNGSLFTRNTIGGATGDTSTYTLPGGQFTNDRNLAQYYDLNYVRKVPLNCSAPESERGVSFIIKYNPQVQVNPPKLFGE